MELTMREPVWVRYRSVPFFRKLVDQLDQCCREKHAEHNALPTNWTQTLAIHNQSAKQVAKQARQGEAGLPGGTVRARASSGTESLWPAGTTRRTPRRPPSCPRHCHRDPTGSTSVNCGHFPSCSVESPESVHTDDTNDRKATRCRHREALLPFLARLILGAIPPRSGPPRSQNARRVNIGVPIRLAGGGA